MAVRNLLIYSFNKHLLHTDPMEDIDILKIGGFYTLVVNNHNSMGRIQHIKVVCRLLWDFRRRREGNSGRTGQSGLASQRRWHPSWPLKSKSWISYRLGKVAAGQRGPEEWEYQVVRPTGQAGKLGHWVGERGLEPSIVPTVISALPCSLNPAPPVPTLPLLSTSKKD